MIRKQIDCQRCSLHGQTKVWGKGPLDARIVLVGESPGSDEVEKGEPFVGPAGRTLNWNLGKANIRRDRCYITNVCCCQPPYNDIASFDGEIAVGFCKVGLKWELEQLKEKRVIVALGGTALATLGFNEKITKARGSVYKYGNIPLVAAYHPSHVHRAITNKQDDSYSLEWLLGQDLSKALEVSQDDWKFLSEDFNIFPTLREIIDFTEWVERTKPVLALDIETAYNDISIIGFGIDREKAIVIPLFLKGMAPCWEPVELKVVKQCINRIFQSGAKFIVQNALFDVYELRKKLYRIGMEQVIHDTMMLNHAISPEAPHNLGFIVSIYGTTPYWKGTLRDREMADPMDIPTDEYRTYNARDNVVLHQILQPMLESLTMVGTEEVYYNESMKLLKPLLKMKEVGIGFDPAANKKYRKYLEGDLEETEEKLRKIGSLPKCFNFNSSSDLIWFIFGKAPTKFSKLDKLDKEGLLKNIKRLRGRGKPLAKAHRDIFDLMRLKNGVKPIYIAQDIKVKMRKGKSGNPSLDEGGRITFQRSLQNRLVEIEKLKRPTEEHAEEKGKILRLLEWFDVFQTYQETNKLYTTYTKFDPGVDGRIRTTLVAHGTVTGRLASKKPNLQNIPKENKEIRKCFVPSPGKILMNADYDNLEAMLLAFTTEDEGLMDVFLKGLNLHDMNTKTFFGLDKPPKEEEVLFHEWDNNRDAAKILFFGGLSYDGSAEEIYRNILIKCPKVKVTLAVVKNAIRNFEREHPGYAEWKRKVQEMAKTQRVSITPFGRKRFLFGSPSDNEKIALNTPIQGMGAHIINRALIRLDERTEKENIPWDAVLQVHDELLYELLPENVGLCSSVLVEEMTRPVVINGRNVPLRVKVGTGYNFGEMKNYEYEAVRGEVCTGQVLAS